MMDDRLEEFMRTHRDEFDDKEASEQLWPRISGELDKRDSGKKTAFRWSHIWKAAAVFFFIVSTWLVVEKVKQSTVPPPGEPLVSEEYVDFAEADRYYTALIQHKKEEIEDVRLANSQLGDEFLQEVSQLDSMYVELKQELEAFKYNEQLMDAVIRNLQLRVEILNQQIILLQKIKKKKEERSVPV